MAHPHPRRHYSPRHRSHRHRSAGTVLVAATIALTMVASACSSDGSSDETTGGDTTESATTSGGTASTKSTAEEDPSAPNVATITDAEGAIVEATITPVAAGVSGLTSLPSGFEAAGQAVELELVDDGHDGPGLVTVSLPGDEPPAGAVPVMLHQTPVGTWEMEAADYADGFYTVRTSSFSIRMPGFITDTVEGVSDWAMNQLPGRNPEPDNCRDETYPWVAVNSQPVDESFYLCLRPNPDPATGVERVEVEIVSNRSLAMWITLPAADPDYVWIEGLADWDYIAPVITHFDEPRAGDRVLLAPGRRMTVGYRRPVGDGLTLGFSSYQTVTTQVVSLIYNHVGEMGVMGAVIGLVGCALKHGHDSVQGRSAQTIDQGFVAITKLGLDLARDCLWQLAGEAIGTSYYDSLVRRGRAQLSARDSLGLEALIDRARTVSEAVEVFNRLVTITDLASLAAETTSMASDALLGFIPDANTVTVHLVAAKRPDDPTVDGCPRPGSQPTTGIGEAIAMICLALAGNDDQTRDQVADFLATEVWLGPEEEDPVPFDRDPLLGRLGEIHRLTDSVAEVRPSPDAHPDAFDPALAPSCDFSHGLICEVDLHRSDGRLVASVSVVWYGDGISDFLVIDPGETPAVDPSNQGDPEAPAAPTNIQCVSHYGDAPIYTPEIVEVTWVDQATDELTYLAVTRHTSVTDAQVIEFDLGADATRLVFLTTDFVARRLVSLEVVDHAGVGTSVKVDPSGCSIASSADDPVEVTPGAGAGRLDVSWSAPPLVGEVTGYEVVVFDANGPMVTYPATARSFEVGGLDPGQQVRVEVNTCYAFADWCGTFHLPATITVPSGG